MNEEAKSPLRGCENTITMGCDVKKTTKQPTKYHYQKNSYNLGD